MAEGSYVDDAGSKQPAATGDGGGEGDGSGGNEGNGGSEGTGGGEGGDGDGARMATETATLVHPPLHNMTQRLLPEGGAVVSCELMRPR